MTGLANCVYNLIDCHGNGDEHDDNRGHRGEVQSRGSRDDARDFHVRLGGRGW